MTSLILIFITSLFFAGITIRTKSILSGRKGPGILQPVKDVLRLFRKGAVYSKVTSFVFRIAPTLYLTTTLTAILFIPIGSEPGLLSFSGDFIFFAYVLAFGKFMMILSAMDTGSSFEGMGASREALYSFLAEPAFFVVMASLALYTGHTSFHEIFQALRFESYASYTFAALSAFVFVILAMIENSRMPVDDPKTHLELTMIHEVMILDNSGFDLGLILYSTYLKFAMYGALIANIFIDAPPLTGYPLATFVVVQILFAVVVGTIESFMARSRMNHNSQFILSLTSVSLLIFLGILLVIGD